MTSVISSGLSVNYLDYQILEMKLFQTILILLFAQLTFAIEYKYGGTISIDEPVHTDLYIAGGTVVINAAVHGDITIAGGHVQINDSVMQDILIVGGTIIVKGYAGDDIRCAGGTISIRGEVAGDVVATGGEIQVERTASIGSLTCAGGKIIADGIIRGSAKSASQDFTLNGTIQKNADLRGGNLTINGRIGGKLIIAASRQIRITSNARIGRSIQYWLPLKRPLIVPASVSDQRPIYDPLLSITHERWYFLGASTFLGLLWYLGMAFVMIVILQYLFSVTFSRSGKSFHTTPLRSGILGIAFFVATPVAIFVLIASIIGVPVAAIVLVCYIGLLLLATVISSLVVTHWVLYISKATWGYWRITGTALFTFVLLKVISFTPFFGWALMLVIAAIAFGSIMQNIKFRPATASVSN